MKYTADSFILVNTPSGVSQEQILRGIMSKYRTPTYNEWDFSRHILPAYFEVCAQTQVDVVLAIAQVIHETGNFTSWWSQRPRRNPAGIGVTGRTQTARPEDISVWAHDVEKNLWRHGLSFPSWKTAAEVHVGRLVAYAAKATDQTAEQRYFSELALAYRALPAHLHGCAPTLKGLNGTWAFPGFTYATRIAAQANYLIQA